MAGKNTAVFAIFDRQGAELAVDALKAAGFRSTDISCLMQDNAGTKDFAHEKATKAPEGAATGATAGAILGGALGFLTGVGSLALPILGPVIVAGPIVALLAGMGIGGAVGGLTGALVGLGMPEYEAKRYEGLILEGKALLSVHCDGSEWTKKAKEILKDAGGKDIASAGEARTKRELTTNRPMRRNDEITAADML